MKNIWLWVVVAVIVIGGGYWLLQGNKAPAISDDGTPVATDVAEDSSGGGAAGQTQLEGTPAPVDSGTTVGGDASVNVGASAPMTASVTYNGSSFSPASVTIKQGGKVTFTSTAGNMWVASAPHPAHTGYDGTSRDVHCAAGYTGAAPFDQCAAGTSYTFTFNKVGTWPYHNHLGAGAHGSVTVVQ